GRRSPWAGGAFPESRCRVCSQGIEELFGLRQGAGARGQPLSVAFGNGSDVEPAHEQLVIGKTVEATHRFGVRQGSRPPHHSPACLPQSELEKVSGTGGRGVLLPFGNLVMLGR